MVTTNEEAVREVERLARSLAMRNGMVSGYFDIHIGAGNPAFFFQVVYQHDAYDEHGFAKKGGAVVGEGPTLVDAMNRLLEQLGR